MSPDPSASPAQKGRTILVTGANAGLGYFTSEQLARAGAHVILSGRNPERLDAAVRALRKRVPEASVETLVIDVASLESVRAGARALDRPLDALVANAGIVHTPRERRETADGFELALGTNLLGHVALVDGVFPQLAGGRIVWLGSISARLHASPMTDLAVEGRYTPWHAYAQSKSAVQAFGFELDRRLRAAGLPIASIVAHPGYAIGGRTRRVPGVNEPSLGKRLADTAQIVIAQGKETGARPVVHAATDPAAEGGQYWGPRLHTRGRPVLQRPPRSSRDPVIGLRVWRYALEATGARFDGLR